MLSASEIKSAFSLLEIEPTTNPTAIKAAYRKAAMQWHPDKFQSDAEKQQAHRQFIRRAEARDLIFEALGHPDLLAYLSGRPQYAPPPFSEPEAHSSGAYERPRATRPSASREAEPTASPQEKRNTAYETEWQVFVEDKNAYFDVMTSASAAAEVLGQTFLVSTSVSLAMGGMVAIIFMLTAMAGTAIAAILLGSVAIPFYGWIGMAVIFNWSVETLGKIKVVISSQIDAAAVKMMGCVSRTGYPTRGFWMATAASVSLTSLVDLWLFNTGHGFLGFLVFVMVFVMFGSLVAVHAKIGQKLKEMDSAFDKIRATSSYALVITSSKAT